MPYSPPLQHLFLRAWSCLIWSHLICSRTEWIRWWQRWVTCPTWFPQECRWCPRWWEVTRGHCSRQPPRQLQSPPIPLSTRQLSLPTGLCLIEGTINVGNSHPKHRFFAVVRRSVPRLQPIRPTRQMQQLRAMRPNLRLWYPPPVQLPK